MGLKKNICAMNQFFCGLMSFDVSFLNSTFKSMKCYLIGPYDKLKFT